MKEGIFHKKSLRPTTGKVREALFNIIRGEIPDACFLDLYAGTGAVGLEALKQGSSEAVFVETKRSYVEKISRRIKQSGFSTKTNIITKKVLSFIEWAGLNQLTFDIIFLDPPYHTDEILYALSAIGKSHILRKEGVVIAEHFAKRQLPERFGSLHRIKDYIYGDSVLSLYKEFR